MSPTPIRRSRPLHGMLLTTVLAGAFATSGCAAFNRADLELVMVRNISIGQELSDLKKAKDEGAMTDEEYAMVKGKIMAMADKIDIAEATNDYVPDQVKKPDKD